MCWPPIYEFHLWTQNKTRYIRVAEKPFAGCLHTLHKTDGPKAHLLCLKFKITTCRCKKERWHNVMNLKGNSSDSICPLRRKTIIWKYMRMNIWLWFLSDIVIAVTSHRERATACLAWVFFRHPCIPVSICAQIIIFFDFPFSHRESCYIFSIKAFSSFFKLIYYVWHVKHLQEPINPGFKRSLGGFDFGYSAGMWGGLKKKDFLQGLMSTDNFFLETLCQPC